MSYAQRVGEEDIAGLRSIIAGALTPGRVAVSEVASGSAHYLGPDYICFCLSAWRLPRDHSVGELNGASRQ